MQLDLVGDAGFLPVAPGNGGVFIADITGDNLAVVGQGDDGTLAASDTGVVAAIEDAQAGLSSLAPAPSPSPACPPPRSRA